MKICVIGIILSVVSVTYGVDTFCELKNGSTCVLYNAFYKGGASISSSLQDTSVVKRVEIAGPTSHYILQPLLSTFQNLEEIIVENGTIAELKENSTTLTSNQQSELKVTKIKFSRGSLTTLSSRAFMVCKKLVHLDLSKNEISTISDNFDEGLQLLETLILDDNKVDVSSSFFKSSKMTNLKYISFAGNKLTSLPDPLAWTNVVKVDVSRNELTTIPSSYTTFVKLQELNLEQNRFTTLHVDIFSGLTEFKTLNIAFNNFSSFDFLRKAPKLENLNIAWQAPKLKGFFNGSLLEENKELKTFNASDNEITVLYKSLFTNNAGKITYLDMKGNRINKVDGDLMSSLTSLNETNFLYNRCISKNFTSKPADSEFIECNSASTLIATAIISVGVILSRMI